MTPMETRSLSADQRRTSSCIGANNTTSCLVLYYLRARYYNPLTGRFMSRDPEDGKVRDPQTLHKYLYAEGDPINGDDPTGHDDLLELAGRVAGDVNIYNGSNTVGLQKQCEAFIFAGIAKVLDTPQATTATLVAFDSYLTNVELGCVK